MDEDLRNSPVKSGKTTTFTKIKNHFNRIKGSSSSKSSKSRGSTLSKDVFDSSSEQLSPDSTPNVSPAVTPVLNSRKNFLKPLIHQMSYQSTGTFSSQAESYVSSDVITPPDSELSTETVSQAQSDSPAEGSLAPPPVQSAYIELSIISGSNLIARDRNGFSDPYCKVKHKGKVIYKTEIVQMSLNPVWNETVTRRIEDISTPLLLRVYDYDRLSEDDFMGQVYLELNKMEKDSVTECKLALEPKSLCEDIAEELGYVTVRCMVKTENSASDVTDAIVSPTTYEKISTSGLRNLKNAIKQVDEASLVGDWDYTVCVLLVEGKNLLPMDDNGFSDPYVRFKFQRSRYKTKTKNKTLNPVWNEEFRMHLYESKGWELEMNVYDHDIAGRPDFMGRASLDLRQLAIDKTHDVTVELEDEAGALRLLITITGAVSSADHEVSSSAKKTIQQQYGLTRSLKHVSDVGWLQLKVIRARNLSSMDWGGKSDPFCTVQLVNTTLQTHTAYSTLNPEWNRVFTMPIHDIHSILEITVYDEDSDMKKEFIGKVAIPLVMADCNASKWYGLKDSKLLYQVKGEIQIELFVAFNHFKAAIRTFNPPEEKLTKPEPKFKISTFKRNVNRVRNIIAGLTAVKDFWQSLIDWDTPSRTVTAFIAFMVAVWNFQLYMLPLTLIIIFLWNYFILEIRGSRSADSTIKYDADGEDDESDDANDDDRDGKKSLGEYIDTIKSVGTSIQEILGGIADFSEAIKNSFTWTVPWLSALGMVVLTIATVILILVPLRYIILLWGLNKFTKKLRNPNYIPNNEVLDYLSRVPSDLQKTMYEVIIPDLDGTDADTIPRRK